jgi:hypothetical protein
MYKPATIRFCLLQSAEHARMIRARILTNYEDCLSVIEILKSDCSLPDPIVSVKAMPLDS